MAPTLHTSRRAFLRTSAATAATLAFPAIMRGQNLNSEARIAVIGTGGQGGGHCKRLMSDTKGCRLVAVADADYTHADGIKAAAAKNNVQIETYQDFRKLLENKDIDGVIIATPNHWHSLMGIMALQAGKHVYVEKPVSHNIWEGRMLAKAAEKFPKLVAMHGMQRRSASAWAEISEFVKDKNGPLGKFLLSRALCYKLRDNIGKVDGPQQPPAGLDYNLWAGPREPMPIMRKRFHYDWHWQWPWGNGDIGNQGPHQLDVARRVIGDPADLPSAVFCIGGRFGYEDDATTANTQIVFYDYKPVPVIMEVRGLPNKDMNFRASTSRYNNTNPAVKTGVDVGNILHFEGGIIAESTMYDKDGKVVKKFGENQGGSHQQHFVDAIKKGALLEEGHGVLTGHHAASLAHMGNVSYRMGQESTMDLAAAAAAKQSAQFGDAFDKLKQHFLDNKLDLGSLKPLIGPLLAFDPKTEQFIGEMAEKANALATDSYRPEFSIKL